MGLSGKRILITRASEDQRPLAERLEARRAIPIEFPCIAFAEPDPAMRADRERAIDRLLQDPPAAIGLASPRAAETLASLLRARGVAKLGPLLSRSIVAAAGEGTAAALARLGIAAIHPEDTAGAEALADVLIHALEAQQPAARVLLPQAARSNPALASKLREAGFSVEVAVLYQTVPSSTPDESHAGGLRALRAHAVDAIAFASGSAATGFALLLGNEAVSLAASTLVACMGSACARVAAQLGFQVAAVGASGFDSMLDALDACYSGAGTAAGGEASQT